MFRRRSLVNHSLGNHSLVNHALVNSAVVNAGIAIIVVFGCGGGNESSSGAGSTTGATSGTPSSNGAGTVSGVQGATASTSTGTGGASTAASAESTGNATLTSGASTVTSGAGGSSTSNVTSGTTVAGTTASTTGAQSTTSGQCSNVRPTGTEWDEATCDQWASETSECGNAWMIDNHYCDESCGRCVSTTSVTSATSATSNTSNTSTTGSTTQCSEPDKTICENEISTHCGYTYEFWRDSGGGCMVAKAGGNFSMEWGDGNNVLARKGIRPGSSSLVVTYDADYSADGTSFLGVYGWTQNPLIEYYIVDAWGGDRPGTSGDYYGTVSSDGGSYDIYRTQQVNRPSIESSSSTFYQYWSVRSSQRTSGSITVGNHFSAWQDAGLTLGSLYEVSMVVEGYHSTGSGDVQMSMQ